MITNNKYRILIGVIVILLATNLSMGLSFLYHKQQDKKMAEEVKDTAIEIPAQQRTRYLREQLNLQPGQMATFRKLNRDFNRKAWNINHRLQRLRFELIEELGRRNPDKEKLASVAEEIGLLHKNLKQETIHYYLNMSETCNEEQRQKLNALFMSMLSRDKNIKLPHRGRRIRNR